MKKLLVLLMVMVMGLSYSVFGDTVNSTAVEDTHVRSNNIFENYGTQTTVSVTSQTDRDYQMMFGFNVSEAVGKNYLSATFEIYPTIITTTGGDYLQFYYCDDNDLFDETVVHFNNIFNGNHLNNCSDTPFANISINSFNLSQYNSIDITSIFNNDDNKIFDIYVNTSLDRYTATATTHLYVESSENINRPLILANEDPFYFNVDILSPQDSAMVNTKPTMTYQFNHSINSTVSCGLYLNDALNLTNSSVSNSTTSAFYLDLVEGSNTFYINCSDGTQTEVSSTQNIWYDPNDPFISAITPNPFNTTTFSNQVMNITGNITNEELEYINIVIYDHLDNLFYSNLTTSFPDPTTFVYDWDFDTNYSQNGDWDMFIYANDTSSNINALWITFLVNNCIPFYSCSGYGACNSSDLSPCNTVIDLNACGINYTGDYSEFTPQACNYCSAEIYLHTNTTECVDGYREALRSLENYDTCCNITNISDDCFNKDSFDFIQDGKAYWWTNVTCSFFDYSESDIAPATIDLLVLFILTAGIYVSLLVFGVTFKWIYNQMKK